MWEFDLLDGDGDGDGDGGSKLGTEERRREKMAMKIEVVVSWLAGSGDLIESKKRWTGNEDGGD